MGDCLTTGDEEQEKPEDLGWCANCRKAPATVRDEETVGDNALCEPCLEFIEWTRENPGVDPTDPRI